MKLLINCYSKEQHSIQIDYSSRYPMVEGERGGLFLFACYALRQLHNLGDHMVADALAGLLTIDPIAIMNKEKELPSGAELLVIKPKNILMARGINETEVILQTIDTIENWK